MDLGFFSGKEELIRDKKAFYWNPPLFPQLCFDRILGLFV